MEPIYKVPPFCDDTQCQIKRPKYVWTAGACPTGQTGEFELECGMGVPWMNRRMGPSGSQGKLL